MINNFEVKSNRLINKLSMIFNWYLLCGSIGYYIMLLLEVVRFWYSLLIWSWFSVGMRHDLAHPPSNTIIWDDS